MISQEAITVQAEEEARRQAAEAAKAEKHRTVREILTAIAKAAGTEHAHVTEENRLMINGMDATYMLSIQDEQTHLSSWRSKANGRKRIAVGDYGSRKSYPQRKDGTHNYDAIAAQLKADVSARQARDRMYAARNTNDKIVRKFCEEHGVREFGTPSFQASADPSKPIRVKMEVAVTEERAAELIALLRSGGFMK